MIKLLIGLDSSFIYGFIIVIAIVLFMGHVLSLFRNATLGGCLLRQAGQPWGTLLLSGRTPKFHFYGT